MEKEGQKKVEIIYESEPADHVHIKQGGKVTTLWADCVCRIKENTIEETQTMTVNGRDFIVTSVFPKNPKSTPTQKLKAYIDMMYEKEIHNQ